MDYFCEHNSVPYDRDHHFLLHTSMHRLDHDVDHDGDDDGGATKRCQGANKRSMYEDAAALLAALSKLLTESADLCHGHHHHDHDQGGWWL